MQLKNHKSPFLTEKQCQILQFHAASFWLSYLSIHLVTLVAAKKIENVMTVSVMLYVRFTRTLEQHAIISCKGLLSI